MKKETKQSYQERILRVLLFIQKNLDSDLSLDTLSSIAILSPFHFHRVFSGMIGESLAEHVRRLRLERAVGMLSKKRFSVTDIAFDAGYNTVESFSRAFKKQFGVLPSEYRKTKYLQGDEYKKHFAKREFQFFKKGEYMMDVKITKFLSQKVLFVRHIGPYNECEKAWGILCSWAGTRGLIKESTKFLGLCYDDPEVTPADKIRYDACLTVDSDIPTEGEIGIQEIPAGEYAVTIHKGPYEKLAATYSVFCGQWFAESDREMKHAPSVELYLNDPKNTPPEDLLVEIRILLDG